MGQVPQGTKDEGFYKSPKVQYIRPHHRHMARLAAAGLTPTEIATITGFSNGQITRILGTPAFQSYLASLEDMAEVEAVDLRDELMSMGEKALVNLSADLDIDVGENPQLRGLRHKTSVEVLDRIGLHKRTSPNEVHLHKHKTVKVKVKEMSNEELLDDVMGFIKGD